MNMVVRTEEGAVSLLVDEIGDVVEVDADLRGGRRITWIPPRGNCFRACTN